MRTLLLTLTACLFVLPATAKYSGGTGEPNDPYQIATAADLIALGEDPNDYNKHFILTADIDLDPNLPARKVFDKAVIAPGTHTWDWPYFQGTPFTGMLDGNGHTISHLTITGGGYLGLIGQLGQSPPCGQIRNIGVVDVNISTRSTRGGPVGGVVGYNYFGSVTQCHSTGTVSSDWTVGGLVGENFGGTVTKCYSMSAVTGDGYYVGGLMGYNGGSIATSYSTGAVSGDICVGGLVGHNEGTVTQCHSTSAVSGTWYVGGLVGRNGWCDRNEGSCWGGEICECYSTGATTGASAVGGLVGITMGGRVVNCFSSGAVRGDSGVGGLVGTRTNLQGEEIPVINSFWDIQTSGQATSDGGAAKTTAEMRDPNTFMAVGWDFVGQPDGPHDIWADPEGGGYPVLWWQLSPLAELPRFSGGSGEPNDPYRISTPAELASIGHNPRLMGAHFELVNDIDLGGIDFYIIGSEFYPFTGSFNGSGHTVSHLTVMGGSYVGLFACVEGKVNNLGVVDVNIIGSGKYVGGLVGENNGDVTNCYSTGTVSGSASVGGLVGYNCAGTVTQCYSIGAVDGNEYVGGLAGDNYASTVIQCYSTASVNGHRIVGGLVGRTGHEGILTQCYSTGVVSGTGDCVGGLVGYNHVGSVSQCCSSGAVGGTEHVGGLVGFNGSYSTVIQCYSTSTVSGSSSVGGLVGGNYGTVTYCYSTGMVAGTREDVGGIVGCAQTSALPGFIYGTATACFWDTQTSGQATSAGGTGKTTIEMRTASTFLDAGWDFVDETANGTEDIWWIDEGKDYPKLWWEAAEK